MRELLLELAHVLLLALAAELSGGAVALEAHEALRLDDGVGGRRAEGVSAVLAVRCRRRWMVAPASEGEGELGASVLTRLRVGLAGVAGGEATMDGGKASGAGVEEDEMERGDEAGEDDGRCSLATRPEPRARAALRTVMPREAMAALGSGRGVSRLLRVGRADRSRVALLHLHTRRASSSGKDEVGRRLAQ